MSADSDLDAKLDDSHNVGYLSGQMEAVKMAVEGIFGRPHSTAISTSTVKYSIERAAKYAELASWAHMRAASFTEHAEAQSRDLVERQARVIDRLDQ